MLVIKRDFSYAVCAVKSPLNKLSLNHLSKYNTQHVFWKALGGFRDYYDMETRLVESNVFNVENED